MNKGKIFLICLAGLFAAACAKDNVDQTTVPTYDAAIAKKFVNTSANAVAGKLLVYVDKECVAQLEAANGSICTGVSTIDDVAEQIGATGITQLFNMKVNAAYKRDLGMDRWFTINFSNEVSVDDAAKALAATEAVRRVEFAKVCNAPEVGEPKLLDPSRIAATRALATSFPNDECFVEQWHLLNVGNRVEPQGVELDEEGKPTGEMYYTYDQYDDPGFIHPYANAGADINVVPAWDLTKGNSNVIVAVIDQGVDFTHEDLAANMWVNQKEADGVEGVDDDGNGYIDDIHGYNFIDNTAIVATDKDGKQIPNPILPQDHGTHVAGTIAAVSNNEIGVAGVAGGNNGVGGARIMSCQILGGEKNIADQDAAARAMEYAADNGAVISQNSWGNDPGVLTTDNAYKTAMSARYAAFNYFMNYKNDKGESNHPALEGGIIVFAAGNESAPMAGYPGAYNEYISVTALGPDGLPALYTNYGPGCNIAAPGGEIFVNQFGHAMDTGGVISTLPNNQYGSFQGTSMATPHVSGVAALALSYAEDLGKRFTNAQFKELLLTSVEDLNQWLVDPYGKMSTSGQLVALSPYNGQMGTGAIDAYRVLSAMHGTVCVPVVAGKENVISVMDLIADGQTTLKIMEDITIPADVRERLGIKNETIFGDKLIFTCEKTGTGVIKVALVAGGDIVGGGNAMGGMRVEKEIAIISRAGHNFDDKGNVNGSNGWL